MFSLPGILSQRQSADYVSTILADSPLVFLMVENNGLTVLDSQSYPSGYPSISGTPQFGGQILRGYSQSLRNTSTSTLNSSATTFLVRDSNTFVRNNINTAGSAEMWFLLESTQTASRILSLHDNIYCWVSSIGGNNAMGLANRSLATPSVSSTLSLNTPYHIVFAWGANVARIYINGQIVLSSSYTGTQTTSFNSGVLCLGSGRSSRGDQAVNGLMQAPALYGYTLTNTQVTTHYNAGKP